LAVPRGIDERPGIVYHKTGYVTVYVTGFMV
jgi:hypothetical protein